MEKGKYVEIPVKRAPSVSVKLGASGAGIRDVHQLEDGTLTINSVTLNPLTCSIYVSNPSSWDIGAITQPRLLFHMTDGSVRTQSQMLHETDGSCVDDNVYVLNYEFKDVQDLNKIAGIIACDMEYPLDGSKPFAVEHDVSLDPIVIEPLAPLSIHHSGSLPVRELMEKLGGTCEWDPKTGDVTCTYRGVSLVMRDGEKTFLVDGVPEEFDYAPPGVVDGKFCLDEFVPAFDAWGLYGFIQSVPRWELAPPEGGGVPCDWDNWYIVP